MAISFSQIRVPTLGGISARLGKIRRRHLIGCAFGILAIMAAFLILTDGYLFYTTVVSLQAPQAVSAPKHSLLSSRDIDEVIRLLDARQQKLEEILSGGHL